jgi:hypothetical protein
MLVIWGRDKAKYFFKSDWTGGIALIRFNKFAVWRKPKKPGRALSQAPHSAAARHRRGMDG